MAQCFHGINSLAPIVSGNCRCCMVRNVRQVHPLLMAKRGHFGHKFLQSQNVLLCLFELTETDICNSQAEMPYDTVTVRPLRAEVARWKNIKLSHVAPIPKP